MTITLDDLKEEALELADMVNSNFITERQQTRWINQGYSELYDLIIATYQDTFIQTLNITVTTTDGYYTLPESTVYKLRGVDKIVDTQPNAISLKRFNFDARNQYNGFYSNVFVAWPQNVQYAFLGSQIKLIPPGNSQGNYVLWYYPFLTPLDDGYNTTMLPELENWAEYITTSAAIKYLQKEESDASTLIAEKNELKNRIVSLATNRDAGQPEVVSNVENYGGGLWDWGFWR